MSLISREVSDSKQHVSCGLLLLGKAELPACYPWQREVVKETRG